MDSNYLHFTIREEGLIREIKLYLCRKSSLKCRGAYERVGVIAGFYGTRIQNDNIMLNFHYYDPTCMSHPKQIAYCQVG